MPGPVPEQQQAHSGGVNEATWSRRWKMAFAHSIALALTGNESCMV
jgi:hypothetical protein